MAKTKLLPYVVLVEVEDNGECRPGDIGEGIQLGIDKVMAEGILTRDSDTSTIVKGITTCYTADAAKLPQLRALFTAVDEIVAPDGDLRTLDLSRIVGAMATLKEVTA